MKRFFSMLLTTNVLMAAITVLIPVTVTTQALCFWLASSTFTQTLCGVRLGDVVCGRRLELIR
jgi:hypothetical protein